MMDLAVSQALASTPAHPQAEKKIARYLPQPDVVERFSIKIRAPRQTVMNVAYGFRLEDILLVRAIFWLRSIFYRVPYQPMKEGLVAATRSIGWGTLMERPNYLLMGAVCKPWVGQVIFHSVSTSDFANYASPDEVKIAWTLEAEAIESDLTSFSSETRAVGTDEGARRKFAKYWRKFGIGIRMIRWIVLPVIKRTAEKQWRNALTDSCHGKA